MRCTTNAVPTDVKKLTAVSVGPWHPLIAVPLPPGSESVTNSYRPYSNGISCSYTQYNDVHWGTTDHTMITNAQLTGAAAAAATATALPRCCIWTSSSCPVDTYMIAVGVTNDVITRWSTGVTVYWHRRLNYLLIANLISVYVMTALYSSLYTVESW